jgi:hypothetical protein
MLREGAALAEVIRQLCAPYRFHFINYLLFINFRFFKDSGGATCSKTLAKI